MISDANNQNLKATEVAIPLEVRAHAGIHGKHNSGLSPGKRPDPLDHLDKDEPTEVRWASYKDEEDLESTP